MLKSGLFDAFTAAHLGELVFLPRIAASTNRNREREKTSRSDVRPGSLGDAVSCSHPTRPQYTVRNSVVNLPLENDNAASSLSRPFPFSDLSIEPSTRAPPPPTQGKKPAAPTSYPPDPTTTTHPPPFRLVSRFDAFPVYRALLNPENPLSRRPRRRRSSPAPYCDCGVHSPRPRPHLQLQQQQHAYPSNRESVILSQFSRVPAVSRKWYLHLLLVTCIARACVWIYVRTGG